MLEHFIHALVALVAVSSVLPILPVVAQFTAEMDPAEGRSYKLRALMAGNLVGLAFMVLAPPLFDALSLTVNDLRIAGGIVLLVYATHDILFSRIRGSRRQVGVDAEHSPAVAPLGVPILIGPATLSTLLVLSEVHGFLPVAVALGVNATLNAGGLVLADRLLAFMGEGSSRAVGKVMSLVLATLGAGMLRAGVLGGLT
ncbi:MAG: MarC family protein [Deltaproteobacteria bacterium]|nr:MarC family protein [Deltaproteobacteria bacterium]MCB9786639.1 MarC family protein [Deltaproteobacteria bacterium]